MSTPPPERPPTATDPTAVAPGVTASGPAARPVARTKADLAAHEGQPIRVEGTYRFPTQQAFARNELVLADGTVVVLPRPSSGPGAAELVEANAGARLAVDGLVYLQTIPDKYQIIARTPDPYLVELAAVVRLP